MTMPMCVMLAGAALVSSPALAQDKAATGPEKKICKMITPTGTIMGKRFCLTKAEWQQLNDINERNADQGLSGRKLNVPSTAER
jgi:hypothetical protein